MHLAGKGGTKIYSFCYTLYPLRSSLSSLHHFTYYIQPIRRRHLSVVSAANPSRVSERMKKRVGCVRAERPRSKSSVEPGPGPGTAGTPAGSGWWGSQARHWFLLLLGELTKWFPCSRRFMKALLYTWVSEHPVHTSIERQRCHLCFMGVCHTGCTRSQIHTPTPGVHTHWPGSYVCLEKTGSSPHLILPSGKALCGHHSWTQAHRRGPSTARSLSQSSSQVPFEEVITVLRLNPNSRFLIASHYLRGVNSVAGRVTAQQTETRPRTWWRGWSPRSQPTYVNLARWLCVLHSFMGREKQHSQGGMARSYTNPNKQISSRKN